MERREEGWQREEKARRSKIKKENKNEKMKRNALEGKGNKGGKRK